MNKAIHLLALLLLTSTSHAQLTGQQKEIYVPVDCSPVSGRYIVRTPKTINTGVKQGALTVEDYADSMASLYGGTVLGVFDSTYSTYGGFGIDSMSQNDADAMLKNEENVLLVEQVCEASAAGIQADPGWALDRIDQMDLPFSNSFDIPNYTANRTHIYVLDQAIRGFFLDSSLVHNDLLNVKAPDVHTNDHVHFRTDIPEAMRNSLACTIHGTAVAGVIGGSRTGVARNSLLHSYAAFDCQSPARSDTFYLVFALNRILSSHPENYPNERAIINYSAVNTGSIEVVQAVRDLASQNIITIVAMGNNDIDSCNITFLSMPETIAVGASGSINTSNGIPVNPDTRWEFSNYGTCTDIYAPGSSVLTTSAVGTSNLSTESGTSFAVTQVTGTIAVYLEQNPVAGHEDVLNAIKSNASVNKVTNVSVGDNDLLNTCFLDGSCPPPPPTCSPDNYEQNDQSFSATHYALPIDNTGNTTGLTIVSDTGWRSHNYCDDSEDWTHVANLDNAIPEDDYYHFIASYFDTTESLLNGQSNEPICIVRHFPGVNGGNPTCDDNEPGDDAYPAGQLVKTVTVKYGSQTTPTFNDMFFQYHPANNATITGENTDYRMRIVHYKCRIEDLPCNAPDLF